MDSRYGEIGVVQRVTFTAGSRDPYRVGFHVRDADAPRLRRQHAQWLKKLARQGACRAADHHASGHHENRYAMPADGRVSSDTAPGALSVTRQRNISELISLRLAPSSPCQVSQPAYDETERPKYVPNTNPRE